MNAKPILMHVRSIEGLQADRKTQTRRTNGLARYNKNLDGWRLGTPEEWKAPTNNRPAIGGCPRGPLFVNLATGWMESPACPYGESGDLLWVREPWRTAESLDHLPPRELAGAGATAFYENDRERHHPRIALGRYRHARFMPRVFSRLTLHLTDVRVERVQGISEDDAIDEGVEACFPNTDHEHSARDRFRALWNFTNGAGAWDRNEWCWVLCFDVIQANVDDVIADPSRYAIWEPTS